MEKQQGIKIFIVLFSCTLFIFSFSHFGALAYQAMTTDKDVFLQGTTIASVDVSEKSEQEALILVTEQLQRWQNETEISLKYKEKVLPVNLETFHFDVQTTVASAQNGQKNLVSVTLEEKDVWELVNQLSSTLSITEEDFANIFSELLSYGRQLTNGDHQISIQTLIAAGTSTEMISETRMEIEGVSVRMTDWVQELSTITIPAQSQVSFLETIHERGLSAMPAEAMSMIATGIYQTLLPTNFAIIQRHIGQELPNYADLGYEVKVNQDANLDLVFANHNESDYTLELKWSYPTLIIQLKGSPLLYQYTIEETEKQEFQPKTIIQYSPQLPSSQTTVKQEGKPGFLITISRKIMGENGVFIDEELISEDYYAPIEKIEVHGLTSNTAASSESGEEDSMQSPSEPGTEEEDETRNETENSAANQTETDPNEFWGKSNETPKGMDGVGE